MQASSKPARKILISGSASGIGLAARELIEAEGGQAVGLDLHDAEVTADLSTPDGRARAIDGVAHACGDRLDALIACAGRSSGSQIDLSINYFGTLALLEGARPLLARSDAPRAVVITSLAAAYEPDPDILAACLAGNEALTLEAAAGKGDMSYKVSKHALALWCRAKSIAPEWAGERILLNMVAPGLIETPMMKARIEDPDDYAALTRRMPQPLGRHGQAEEIARVLCFLASPLNSLMVGQNIYVDAGSDACGRPAHI